jgi:hypothetical protein
VHGTFGWIKREYRRSQEERRMMREFTKASPRLQEEITAILLRDAN